tara:strand:- start:96 stop:458 length:363 start_codon:yes stop_codon:yes gene_type:complete
VIRQACNINEPTTINLLGTGSSGRDTTSGASQPIPCFDAVNILELLNIRSYSQAIKNSFSDCGVDFTEKFLSILLAVLHRFHLNSVILSVARPPFRWLEWIEAAESRNMPTASITLGSNN